MHALVKKARRPRQASEWLVVGHGHVARVSMHMHTPKSGGVAMGKATVVVAVCVNDVMGCACHPHTCTQDVRAATKAHAIHTMCVRQKSGQWMSTVALWCVWWWLEKRDGVVVGGGKSTERGECGWWMKRGMV